MTDNLDIRINVDGLPSLRVATAPAIIGDRWLALPVGSLWRDVTRHNTYGEAVEAAVNGSVANVRRLLRGEGLVRITQAQADEIVRQVRDGAGWPVEEPRAKPKPGRAARPGGAGQIDMFAG